MIDAFAISLVPVLKILSGIQELVDIFRLKVLFHYRFRHQFDNEKVPCCFVSDLFLPLPVNFSVKHRGNECISILPVIFPGRVQVIGVKSLFVFQHLHVRIERPGGDDEIDSFRKYGRQYLADGFAILCFG